MAKDLQEQWETAKSEFERITGEKKKSKNKLAGSVFSKGLTPTLKDLDKELEKLSAASSNPRKTDKTWAKALKSAYKELAKAEKVAAKYAKTLEADAKLDIANNSGAKTQLSKGLKFLKADIDRILGVARQKVEGLEVTNSDLDTKSKYIALVLPSLASATKVAIAAIKKVKADPTVATWKEQFYVSDPPGRKMHVQLQMAVKGQKDGQLPSVILDPQDLVTRLDDWRGMPPTFKGPQIADDADKKAVLDKLEEFREHTKMVVRYFDALKAER